MKISLLLCKPEITFTDHWLFAYLKLLYYVCNKCSRQVDLKFSLYDWQIKLIFDSVFLRLYIGKRTNLSGPNTNIKKARKGEINYAPEIPEGETMETLIQHKEQLFKEWKKRDKNKDLITHLMNKTYPLRRKEIISSISLKAVHKNWPMLFTSEQVI